MMRAFLRFPLKVNSHPPLYVHITLATDTEAAALPFTQLLRYCQDILKLLAFKRFLNDVLLEIECSEVMLI